MNYRQKNLELSRSKYFYLLIIELILFTIGFSIAWWRWSSSNNVQVFGKVCAPEIVFVGGSTINGTDLLPVLTKEEGLSKDIHINLNNTCDNDTAVINLNLILEYFPSGLSDSSFKWSLYEVTTEEVDDETTEVLTFVNSGNFANKEQTDVIGLTINSVVSSNVSTYRLFIWMDATMDNPSTIGNNTFKFKLYGDGYNAIYNQYTMKQVANTAADASFWGSPINANQVKSIRFVPSDKAPSTYTGLYDVSSVTDAEDIMMYYVENGQTEDEIPITLYDVYVASNNGITNAKANVSAEKMFAYLSNCEYIDAENLDTSKVISMANMFIDSSKLQEISFTNWDTSKVTNMKSMFNNCGTSELTFNISTFDTSKVTSMTSMFENSKASSIKLSNFSNTVLFDTLSMFKNSSASSITFTNFNTSNISRMGSSNNEGMFQGCSNLTSLDLSDFNTSKLNDVRAMFQGCSSLTAVDMSNFNLAKVTSLRRTFKDCLKLKEINIGDTNGNNVTDFMASFENCNVLSKLNVVGFDFTNAGVSYAVNNVPSTVEVIVSDCNQRNLFRTKFGSRFNNVHTVNNDDCNV